MMIQSSTGLGLRRIETLYDGTTVAGMSDAELLERFNEGRVGASSAAFAALLARHGPLVLGVCRRALDDPYDVEDAFQAVFLILVRRANSIRVGDTLGRWLYGVSRRVASRARVIASRRPIPAGDAASGWADPRADVAMCELRAALDDEIARLPRRYREAILLCDVEGLPLKEAARRVGRPLGTVASRLGRGRALLREQLTRRGHAPGASVLMAWLDSGHAHAMPPEGLIEATAKLAAGGPAGMVPTAVVVLGQPILRRIFVEKIRMTVARLLAVGILAVGSLATQAPAVTTRPDDSPRPSKLVRAPVEQYEALVREFIETQERILDEEKRATTPEAIDALRRANPWPLQDRFAAKFLDLSKAQPGDPAAFDALAWVAVFDFTSAASDQAAIMLAGGYGRDPRLWSIAQEMQRNPIQPARGILLRAVLRDSPSAKLRGRACLALAEFLTDHASFVRSLRTPGLAPWQAQFFPADRLEQFRKIDPDAELREAEALFERVIRESADVRPVKLVRSPNMDWDARRVYGSVQDVEQEAGSLADLARPQLDALRNFDVGKPAPEIAAEDVDGKPMALGDFRGKVVLLTFSGDWCGPCVAMYPHEREIVAKFQGRPFAMVSVNSDATREQLRKSIDSGEITWRCWWEPLGDSNGPIATRWHVSGWPTVYLIDHRGTIRVKFVGFVGKGEDVQPPIDAAIEAMVKEAEAR